MKAIFLNVLRARANIYSNRNNEYHGKVSKHNNNNELIRVK